MNLVIISELVEYFFKRLLVKVWFIRIAFKILLLEGRSVIDKPPASDTTRKGI